MVCVIGVLRRRTGWSVEWWISDLYDLCSRFLCRSPVLETQHVHDSRMVRVRWFFAGKFSAATSGATSCTDCEAGKLSSTAGAATCQGCDAGKYSATAGVESVCVVCVCVFAKRKTLSNGPFCIFSSSKDFINHCVCVCIHAYIHSYV